MAELFRNDWWVVTHKVGEPFARLVRTGTPISDLTDSEHLITDLKDALSSFKRVLVDFRGGPPGRNDAPFERATERWRSILSSTFERRAILVKSAVGKLQVTRLNQSSPNMLVTQDEKEALRFLDLK